MSSYLPSDCKDERAATIPLSPTVSPPCGLSPHPAPLPSSVPLRFACPSPVLFSTLSYSSRPPALFPLSPRVITLAPTQPTQSQQVRKRPLQSSSLPPENLGT
ncbi:hypothetical protein I203_102538 [Kwoniella mangroviensis CBS 8507]|uniref:uncharacterized protein n=1 Tax=Kwoniella mangroviensis CBS 8507 TaxID=1296122 RepID=UPI00302B520F